MNGAKLIVDSNILIFWLQGNKDATQFLSQNEIYLSFISELEILSLPVLSSKEILRIKNFLQKYFIIDINDFVKESTLELRRKYLIQLPDAIILATALFLDLPFVTADKRLFKIKEVKIIRFII